MLICFIKHGTYLTLPMTPAGYTWAVGRNIETINISQLGDVYRPGGRSRFAGDPLECLLPAQEYPWMEAGAVADPQSYLDILTAWAAAGEPVRYIVSGTEINTLVYIESVEYREQDGTGDVYASIRLREYTDLEAREVELAGVPETNTGNASRPAESAGESQSYTVVRGDTLSAICRRYYGKYSATYYNALAKFNGIKNPHLIYPGTTITIPPESVLLGG